MAQHHESDPPMRAITSFCLFLAMTAPFVWAQPASAPSHCSGMLQFQMQGVPLAITKADSIPASAPGTLRISPTFPGTIGVAVPAFCRVDGVINQRKGADGKSYGIGFALALPDQWNGRFLFQGGGGLNGNVP